MLLEAGKELIKLRNDFQVFITKGTDTESVVNNYFQGNLPSWVILKDQTEDIASLLTQLIVLSVAVSMKHFLMLFVKHRYLDFL